MSKNPVNDVNSTKVDRVEMPVPSTGIFDYPYINKRANIYWYAHISGIVQGLTEQSAWRGEYPEIARAIDEIHNWLNKDYQDMSCDEIMSCEQLIAIRSATNATTNNLISYGNDIRLLKYDNTPQSISLYAPSEIAPLGEQSEVDLLCYAIDYLLEEYRLVALDNARFRLNALYAFSAIAGLSTAFLPLAGSIFVASTIGIVYTLSEPQLLSFIADMESVDTNTMKCALIDALYRKQLTLANWQSALSALPSYDGALATYRSNFVSDKNTLTGYLSFVQAYGLVRQIEPTLSDDCPCLPAQYQTFFNFVSNDGWTNSGGSGAFYGTGETHWQNPSSTTNLIITRNFGTVLRFDSVVLDCWSQYACAPEYHQVQVLLYDATNTLIHTTPLYQHNGGRANITVQLSGIKAQYVRLQFLRAPSCSSFIRFYDADFTIRG